MKQKSIDWTEVGQPSTAVVEAMVDLTDSDLQELPPLQNTLDVDALDTLITCDQADSESDVQVSFQHEEIEIVVEASGSVTLS